MNKYVLMMAAAVLIAAAPAYYAFQAQAEETAKTSVSADVKTPVVSTDTSATVSGESDKKPTDDPAAKDQASSDTAVGGKADTTTTTSEKTAK